MRTIVDRRDSRTYTGGRRSATELKSDSRAACRQDKPLQSSTKRTDRRASLRSDDYEEWDSRYMLRTDHDDFAAAYNDMWGGQKAWFKPSCVPITIILLLIVLVVLLPLLDAVEKQQRNAEHNNTINKCHQHCIFTLVETIPDGMSYRNGSTPYPSTYDVWKGMMTRATEVIEIASYYWTLRDSDVLDDRPVPEKWPGSEKGEDIFNDLLNAKSRGLKVKIVQSQPSKEQPCKDTEILTRKGAAEVRSINMQRLVGAGILHTKLWMVDRDEVYVGSANTDWRSLAHVKELGLHITNCSCLLEDYGKIFDAYWDMALPDAQIPHKWPADLSTPFNEIHPMSISVNSSEALVYLSSSPPQMCPDGRESDISSIISTIHKADHFIYVAVMDYFPLMIYGAKPTFWPVIDDALRAAAVDRRVEVRLLVSYWNYTRPNERQFLKSLTFLSGSFKGVSISVKFFVVPSSSAQRQIPYARVNHNKYMVTDNIAYVGTSNWSGDYFVNTAGVGTIVSGNTTLRQELEDLFLRDWMSEFAYPI